MNKMIFDSTHALVLLTCLSLRACALEDTRPEVYLPPRNFNPHPYENGFNSRISPYLQQGYQPLVSNNLDEYQRPVSRISGIYFNPNTGPVLFPPTPEEPVVTSKPVVDRLKEIHPYAAVAKKIKYKQSQIGSFINEDVNRINSPAYRALANQGVKVLSLPHRLVTGQLPGLHSGHDNDVTLSDQKKDYEFSYKVENHATGDDFSHVQSQNSHATNGQYRVRLPDGRVQVVRYTADHNGYNAEVSYEEDKGGDAPVQNHEQVVLLQTAKGHYPKVPTGKINVLAPDYDYQLYNNQPSPSSPQPNNNNIPFYDESYSGTSQRQPVHHATSLASYYRQQQAPGSAATYKYQVVQQPRVQIYATGLVGSTAAPQVQENGGVRYRNNVIYSTVAPQVYENLLVSTVPPSVDSRHYLNVAYSTVAPQSSAHGEAALYVDRNTGTKYRLNLGKKK